MFNKLFTKVSLVFISFFMILNISSVSAEFKAASTKSTSVDFTWEAVDKVFIYKINYWTDSSKDVAYDKNTDFIDSTSYTLFDLTPGTTYYLSLVWYDELWNESYKSNEIIVITPWSDSWKSKTLVLEDANLVWKNKVELSFSNEINDLSAEEREFRIENIKDTNDILEVLESEVSKTNKKNLILTLDKEVVVWTEYKVVVLNIRDVLNQNIEFWVDSEATFVWAEIDETMPDLNAASEEEPVGVDNGELGWVDLNSADVDSNVLTEAEDTDKLPKTWPEQILIFILAFVLSGIIFVYRFRRI